MNVSSSRIVCVYLELVRTPYFYLIHTKVTQVHDRFDRYEPKTLRNFMVGLFAVLAEGRPEFLPRLAELDDAEFMKSPQHRRYIAKERDVLYIKSAHLERYSVEFQGYWVGTNVKRTQAGSVARLACQAAGVPCESIRKFPSFASRG